MKTKHYIITNIEKFSDDIKAVGKLKNYLDNIESVFSIIEEVFGQAWNDNRINIELDKRTGGAEYDPRVNPHIVKMGIFNGNIQKKEYPENLWGCLFHETHHAFFNQVINNKPDKKIFNGGCEGEPFNYAFMAATYLKLREKGRIDAQLYEVFLSGARENEKQ